MDKTEFHVTAVHDIDLSNASIHQMTEKMTIRRNIGFGGKKSCLVAVQRAVDENHPDKGGR